MSSKTAKDCTSRHHAVCATVQSVCSCMCIGPPTYHTEPLGQPTKLESTFSSANLDEFCSWDEFAFCRPKDLVLGFSSNQSLAGMNKRSHDVTVAFCREKDCNCHFVELDMCPVNEAVCISLILWARPDVFVVIEQPSSSWGFKQDFMLQMKSSFNMPFGCVWDKLFHFCWMP